LALAGQVNKIPAAVAAAEGHQTPAGIVIKLFFFFTDSVAK
jgi:hypothetical protein